MNIFFQYPWVVSIQQNNSHSCGGTIISKNHVLTAAHCVVYKIGNTVVSVPIDGILELIFGTWTSQNVRIERLLKKGAATKRSIKKITVHEEYKYGVAYYDVAIIEFAEPLVFSPQIQPICVPKSGSQVK